MAPELKPCRYCVVTEQGSYLFDSDYNQQEAIYKRVEKRHYKVLYITVYSNTTRKKLRTLNYL